jgi:hypothetical protein
MKMSQGISLCRYLKQTNKNAIFFFHKIREQEGRKGSCLGGENGTSLEGMWGKGVGGWIWCKYCVHMYVNVKMRPVETVLGMVGVGDKEEW